MARVVIVLNDPLGVGAANRDGADGNVFGFKLADFIEEQDAAQGFGFHGWQLTMALMIS